MIFFRTSHRLLHVYGNASNNSPSNKYFYCFHVPSRQVICFSLVFRFSPCCCHLPFVGADLFPHFEISSSNGSIKDFSAMPNSTSLLLLYPCQPFFFFVQYSVALVLGQKRSDKNSGKNVVGCKRFICNSFSVASSSTCVI